MVEELKKELEKTYISKCDIYRYVVEEIDGIVDTSGEEVKEYEDIPCGISFENTSNSTQGQYSTSVIYAKLFLDTKYKIRINSKFVIRHLDHEYILYNSGIPAIYDTHQEINLVGEQNG